MSKQNEGKVAVHELIVQERSFKIISNEFKILNSTFINKMPVNYFRFIAETNNLQDMSQDDKHNAAIALRMGYFHGLETLFSVLFAALQAPKAVIGWLDLYKNQDIKEIINKIRTGERITTCFPFAPPSWKKSSDLIHFGLHLDDEKLNYEIKELFANTWALFADDFIAGEYNKIKHGFRIIPGGRNIKLGDKEFIGGEFGTSWFSLTRINRTDNYFLGQAVHNWNPDYLTRALKLISLSLQNIKAFLLHVNNIDKPKIYQFPLNPSLFYEELIDMRPELVRANLSLGYKNLK
ncbi:MAG: hypothetical protein KDE48_16475 [Anaerolineales bacterium]|nr:hypothetical protein [Anaerolineales bacterium]